MVNFSILLEALRTLRALREKFRVEKAHAEGAEAAGEWDGAAFRFCSNLRVRCELCVKIPA